MLFSKILLLTATAIHPSLAAQKVPVNVNHQISSFVYKEWVSPDSNKTLPVHPYYYKTDRNNKKMSTLSQYLFIKRPSSFAKRIPVYLTDGD